jgi:hypothetical protein
MTLDRTSRCYFHPDIQAAKGVREAKKSADQESEFLASALPS